jgi:putative ABC transport system ATP-binding protein
MNGNTAVTVHGIRKHFGEGNTRIEVLKGVSLEVRYGELLLLVGPSGCGKTTLLSAIAGILDINAGGIEIFGERFDTMPMNRKTRFRGQNIGFIFQQYNLLPTLTATQNVAVPLLIAGVPRKEAFNKARGLLQRIGMGDRSEVLPSKLSGGQQQRVAIARALIHNPRLIICDEPTANLDGETGMRVMELLRSTARSPDRAMIVVTHDPRIFKYGDRIAEMLDGQIRNEHDNPEAIE